MLIDELIEEELLELCGERNEKESIDIEPKKEHQTKQNVLAEILADAERLMHNSLIHDPIPSENDEPRSFLFAPSFPVFTIFAIVTWTKSLLNEKLACFPSFSYAFYLAVTCF